MHMKIGFSNVFLKHAQIFLFGIYKIEINKCMYLKAFEIFIKIYLDVTFTYCRTRIYRLPVTFELDTKQNVQC